MLPPAKVCPIAVYCLVAPVICMQVRHCLGYASWLSIVTSVVCRSTASPLMPSTSDPANAGTAEQPGAQPSMPQGMPGLPDLGRVSITHMLLPTCVKCIKETAATWL